MSTPTAAAVPALLTKAQVCARLSMSVRHLETLVKRNRFPPPVRLGKMVYWSETAISAWYARLFAPQEAWTPIPSRVDQDSAANEGVQSAPSRGTSRQSAKPARLR